MIEGRRAVVTGGAGTIGSHVVDELITAGASQILVIDNLSRGSLENLFPALQTGRVEFINGDIRSASLVRRACSGADLLFHLAALRITQCADDPRLAHDVLATGTLTVLEAARDCGVGKVIASSSASVYGAATTFPTREDHHPWANDTIYGAAKAYNEGLLASFASTYRIPYVALRYFNVYGPRMDAFGRYTEVLIRWMERIDAGLPPIIEGDGLQTMDFIDVRDAARANMAAACSSVTSGAYNVARGEEVTLRELAAALALVIGRPALTAQHVSPRRISPVSRRLADISAARADLGFTAQIPLSEGLRDLVAWWREITPKRPQTSSSRGNSTSPLVTTAPGGS